VTTVPLVPRPVCSPYAHFPSSRGSRVSLCCRDAQRIACNGLFPLACRRCYINALGSLVSLEGRPTIFLLHSHRFQDHLESGGSEHLSDFCSLTLAAARKFRCFASRGRSGKAAGPFVFCKVEHTVQHWAVSAPCTQDRHVSACRPPSCRCTTALPPPRRTTTYLLRNLPQGLAAQFAADLDAAVAVCFACWPEDPLPAEMSPSSLCGFGLLSAPLHKLPTTSLRNGATCPPGMPPCRRQAR